MVNDPIRVLLVDDDEDDYLLTRDRLADAQGAEFVLDYEANPHSARRLIAEERHDVYLLDYSLGAVTGLDLLAGAIEAGCERPLILLTGQKDAETAERALRLGAADYLVKEQIDEDALARSIRYAIERKRLETELRHLNADLEDRVLRRTQELEKAVEDLRGFTYTVSHDLRAPLRSIVANSRMLSEDYGGHLPPEAIAMLDRQAVAATRLGRLIDDLLTLARVGRAHPERKPLDLTRVFRHAVDEARTSHPETVIVEDVAESMAAYGDERLLALVAFNLIDNAAKFARPGESAQIVVCTDAGPGEILIRVRDQGIGFDPAYEEKIWRPFERLVRDDEVPGTGIGLANVKRIIESHGGRVWATSGGECGTEFGFSLPTTFA
jgi:signal transduction histidine kinase